MSAQRLANYGLKVKSRPASCMTHKLKIIFKYLEEKSQRENVLSHVKTIWSTPFSGHEGSFTGHTATLIDGHTVSDC